MDAIPIFRTHYTPLKSCFTLELPGDSEPSNPKSVFDIAKHHKLKDLYIVDDKFSGFKSAEKGAIAADVNLRFGFRLTLCDDLTKKDEESRKNEHKVIVWLKNSAAYGSAIKIYTKSFLEGFYYYNRLDFKTLAQMWNKNLTLSIPYYDSFLAKNVLTFAQIVPSLDFTQPTFFIENHELYYDGILEKTVKDYCEINKYEIQLAHTCYYYKEANIKNYMVLRCINNRSNLEKPELEGGFVSNKFAFETWLNNVKQPTTI